MGEDYIDRRERKIRELEKTASEQRRRLDSLEETLRTIARQQNSEFAGFSDLEARLGRLEARS